MNKIDPNEIRGVLNYLASTNNFFDSYESMKFNNIFRIMPNDNSPDGYTSMILSSIERDMCVNVKIGEQGFRNLQEYSESFAYEVAPIHSSYSSMSNFFNINTVLSFVPNTNMGLYYSYIVYEKDGNVLCSEVRLSDTCCISVNMNLPIYFNKKIVEKFGSTWNDLQNKLMSGGIGRQ